MLGPLLEAKATRMVEDASAAMEQFFGELEVACDELNEQQAKANRFGGKKNRAWKELRVEIRPGGGHADAAAPAGARGAVQARDGTDDADTGQELAGFNRGVWRVAGRRAAVPVAGVGRTVYWVEKSGKAGTTLSLNAAPVEWGCIFGAAPFSPAVCRSC
ncbi:MAG: hypothetical protein CM1200mP34_3530 [Verrucomicrobiales bacterium]|nr:MAG: hypothetical protein CM1200mP34_3530 [Verrucomicrobiales bacterium]